MPKQSVGEILEACERLGVSFWEAVLLDDMAERQLPRETVMADMARIWQAMLDGAAAYDPALRSMSGMVGGDAARIQRYRAENNPICGDYIASVIQYALCMGECNACMKRIVAAPTAGACGVLPAVLIPLFESGVGKTKIIEGLFTAGGLGEVIAARASIAGASGGCQAEIGAASAMAAGALVHIRGGSGKQIADAAATALSNLLGLVCDPVAGLVEVPCVKRNVVGAMNAMSAADMALAGIESIIPCDEVIDAMAEIGDAMPTRFKETAKGGLAATPTGRAISRKLVGDGA
jgi:L-serine dehydratase